MILGQVILVTLLALVAVTGLLVVLGAVFEAGKSGLGPMNVLILTPYIVAPALPYTLPSCLLLGVTYVLGTMAGSNEIVAVKAGGINVVRLIRPVLLLALLISLGCVVLSDRVIPWAQRKLKVTLLGDIEATLYGYLKQKSCISGPGFPYELYVRGIDDTRLIQPIIKHRKADGSGYDMVLQAREASMRVEPAANVPGEMEIVIRLVDGVLSTQPGNAAYFRDRTERMPIPGLLQRDRTAVADQTFAGLDEQSRQFEREGLRDRFDGAAIIATAALVGDAVTAAHMAETFDAKVKHSEFMAYRARSEKQQRIARSMAGLPFVLLGAPLAIAYRRREVLQTFFVCFLPIITLYYPSVILAGNMIRSAQSELWGLLWIPSILMALAAIPFLRQVIRH